MFGATSKALLATALVGAFAASALARPELNAFINRPANTIPELIAQMKSDPVVMDRFMRHFGMTRSEVLNYVRSLRLGTIRRSARYTIYSVPENGIIKVHTSYFKAGTPAFVDANGNPILRIKCGNPFVRGPRVTALGTPTPTEAYMPRPEPETTSVAQPPELTTMVPPEVPEIATDTQVPVASLPTISDQPASPQGFAIAPILAGLGAAAIFTTGHGSDHKPVPEPATMLVLGGGALALAAKKRRSK